MDAAVQADGTIRALYVAEVVELTAQGDDVLLGLQCADHRPRFVISKHEAASLSIGQELDIRIGAPGTV